MLKLACLTFQDQLVWGAAVEAIPCSHQEFLDLAYEAYLSECLASCPVHCGSAWTGKCEKFPARIV